MAIFQRISCCFRFLATCLTVTFWNHCQTLNNFIYRRASNRYEPLLVDLSEFRVVYITIKFPLKHLYNAVDTLFLALDRFTVIFCFSESYCEFIIEWIYQIDLVHWHFCIYVCCLFSANCYLSCLWQVSRGIFCVRWVLWSLKDFFGTVFVLSESIIAVMFYLVGLDAMSWAYFCYETSLLCLCSVWFIFNLTEVFFIKKFRVELTQFSIEYLVDVSFILLYTHLWKLAETLKILHQRNLSMLVASSILNWHDSNLLI